jgi:hypothetical protein
VDDFSVNDILAAAEIAVFEDYARYFSDEMGALRLAQDEVIAKARQLARQCGLVWPQDVPEDLNFAYVVQGFATLSQLDATRRALPSPAARAALHAFLAGNYEFAATCMDSATLLARTAQLSEQEADRD